MPLPEYQSMMLPLMQIAADGEEHRLRDTIESLADRFKLTDGERNELLPGGSQTVLVNRVSWARSYLMHAGLLSNPRRGFFTITDQGRELLQENPFGIDLTLLQRYPSFLDFRNRRKPADSMSDGHTTDNGETPEDALAAAYEILRSSLETELLQQIKDSSPSFFERLVVDLLVKMGYGGSRREAGRAIGRSGDGGIDGVINEVRLGLDVIYVQAKRWDGTAGRPEIQRFAGALQGQRARKGAFITTSSFSRDALDDPPKYGMNYARRPGDRATRTVC